MGIASIDDERTSTLQDFVIWGLTSSNPSIIGLALLCVAVSLQHLDTRVHQFIIRQLPRLPGDLFQEYFEKVEHLILNDIEYASSDEGIEVTVLLAKIYGKSRLPDGTFSTSALIHVQTNASLFTDFIKQF